MKKSEAFPPALVEIAGEVETETTAAVLLKPVSGREPVWIPKSQSHPIAGHEALPSFEKQAGVISFRIPQWLAKEKGFIEGGGAK